MTTPPKLATSCIRYFIPVRTQSNLNMREHWRERAKRAKAERLAAFMCTAPNLGTPLEIVLTRIAPRMLDSDNLAGSHKHVQDGIADRLGINDRKLKWRYEQMKGKEYGVRVEMFW